MSSFLINKEEYIKAAGLVAGIMTENVNPFRKGECKDKCNRWFYLNMIEYAMRLYELNDMSVSKQYNEAQDGTPEITDTDKVMFGHYKNKAMKMGRPLQIELANNLMYFFNSILYQIEDEQCMYEAAHIIRAWERNMRDALNTNPTTKEWWGSVEFDED